MKKNPIISVIFIFMLSISSSSQDFNLFNPSNELYLFSAYDEGANAFRYNPAVLGLKHRFNANINFLLLNRRSRVEMNEFDLALNFGGFGLAYRTTFKYYDENILIAPYNFVTDNFSLGFGGGNKSFTAGVLFEYIWGKIYKQPGYFDYNRSRFNFSAGVLVRPSDFLSASFVYNHLKSFTSSDYVSPSVTVGLGIRPLRNDIITLLADFSITPYVNHGFFESHRLKLGLNARIINGLRVNSNYIFTNTILHKNESFNVGFEFNFPHFSTRYTNSFNKYERNNRNYYKSDANLVSFSFNSEKKKSLIPEKTKIIEITLSGSLQDFSTSDVFFGLLGKGKRSVHEVIADIDYAAGDPSVKGMLLKIYPVASGRFEISAAIEELAGALERFRKKGKHITAYLAPGMGPENSGPNEYYIATYADQIIIPPDAIMFYGLSISVVNIKQFLEKYGIELENFYAGEYKLVFQGVLDSTTEHGREVINRVLDVVYDKMMDRIAAGRGITTDDYLRSKLSAPITGIEAVRLGLADKTGWYNDAKEISEKNGKTSNIVKGLNRNDWDTEWGEEDRIAIIGIYGTIKPGESEAPSAFILPIPFVGGGRSTGSETVVRQLEDAFSNPKVKAIILRVNSGGGSAVASSEINNAIVRLKKKYKKPFIVSMGNAAASGGYFVSVNADKIFSDDLTVTGSIGVWAALPNLDSLLNEQKIKVETFKRGEHSDIGSFTKKLSKDDVEIIQGLIDFYYERFIEAVSQGRKLSKQEAEEIAKGRVWMGSDAYNKKLVDEIGGLYSAVIYAKQRAKLEKRYKLVYYAVPGGGTISELVTGSIVQYLQANLLDLLGINDDEQGLEIKY